MFHRELDEKKRCLARTVCETSPDCVRDGLCFAQQLYAEDSCSLAGGEA